MKIILASILLVFSIFFGWKATIKGSEEKNQCFMSWMFRREGEKIFSQGKYTLYYYNPSKRVQKPGTGIPIIFVPGNAADHKQIRSIGTFASHSIQPPHIDNFVKEIRDDYFNPNNRKVEKNHLDFFAVDFNEEFSGFSPKFIHKELKFLNQSINYILEQIYHDNTLPFLAIGHSMGSIILNMLNHNNLKTIIALSSPIQRHPFFFDYEMFKTYQEFQTKRKYHYENTEEANVHSPLIVSISGGFRDNLVSFGDTVFDITKDKEQDELFFSSYGIPDVRISSDHQAICWCNQLVQKISNALNDVINVRNQYQRRIIGRFSVTKEEQKEIFNSHFQSHAISKFSRHKKMITNDFFQDKKSIATHNRRKNIKFGELPLPKEDYTFRITLEDLRTKYNSLIDIESSEDSYIIDLPSQFSIYGLSNLEKSKISIVFEDSLSHLYHLRSEIFEYLPFFQTKKNYIEIKNYPINTPKTLLFVNSFDTKFANQKFTRMYVSFNNEKSPQNRRTGGKINFFLKFVDPKTQEEEEIEVLSPFKTTKKITKNRNENGITFMKFPKFSTSIPFELKISSDVKDQERSSGVSKITKNGKQFPKIAFYWKSNSLYPQERFVVSEAEEKEVSTIKIQFFPGVSNCSLNQDEKGFNLLIFSDPRSFPPQKETRNTEENFEVRLDFIELLIYLIKFGREKIFIILVSNVFFIFSIRHLKRNQLHQKNTKFGNTKFNGIGLLVFIVVEHWIFLFFIVVGLNFLFFHSFFLLILYFFVSFLLLFGISLIFDTFFFIFSKLQTVTTRKSRKKKRGGAQTAIGRLYFFLFFLNLSFQLVPNFIFFQVTLFNSCMTLTWIILSYIIFFSKKEKNNNTRKEDDVIWSVLLDGWNKYVIWGLSLMVLIVPFYFSYFYVTHFFIFFFNLGNIFNYFNYFSNKNKRKRRKNQLDQLDSYKAW